MVNGTFVSETSVSQVSDVKLAGVRLGACGCKDQVLARFGPQRVSNTLKQESTPSSTIELAASTKKFAALAPWVDIHQPPMAMNRSRALCASTGPSTLAAPCEEKYIDSASPMRSKVYFNLPWKVEREAATHYRTAQFHHPALEPASQDAAVKV